MLDFKNAYSSLNQEEKEQKYDYQWTSKDVYDIYSNDMNDLAPHKSKKISIKGNKSPDLSPYRIKKWETNEKMTALQLKIKLNEK